MIKRFIFNSLLRGSSFITLILFSSFEVFSSDNKIIELAQSKKWIRSLHYKTSFSRLKPSTTVSGFYLSPIADPYQELLANLTEATRNDSYQCLYPYRAKLLHRAGLWHPKRIECNRLYDWKNVFSTDKLSLAFASQYMSNPASIFGHTFLVFSPDRGASDSHPKFLDLTISYAAQMPADVGAFDYAIKGIGGGFNGRFFDEPLYKKIYEYAQMEMRDLWLYPLKLSSAQIDDFLDHIYELSVRDYFPYYFVDENCSYMLLRVLEVIFDDKTLSDTFHTYVLPIETIKILKQENLLEKGEFIPSIRSKFLAEHDLLSHQEKQEVTAAIEGELAGLTTKDSIDTMITYLDKTKIEQQGVQSIKQQADYQSLLLRRSKMGPKIEKKITYPQLDPILGHGPYALSIKTGISSGEDFQEIEFRPAFHELIDVGHGYIKHSQIKLLSPTVRLNDHGEIKLQQLQFFNLSNLVPYRRMDPILSWTLALERVTLQDKLCFQCQVTRASFGLGPSFSFGQWVDYYLMLGHKFEWGSNLDTNFRNGSGIFSGLLFNFHEKIKAHAFVDFFYADRWGKFDQTVLSPAIEMSYYLSKQFSMRGSYREWRTFPVMNTTHETSASLVHFF